MIRFASTAAHPRITWDELERLLVQRLAGDRRLAAHVAQRPDVVGGAHAAARDHRPVGQRRAPACRGAGRDRRACRRARSRSRGTAARPRRPARRGVGASSGPSSVQPFTMMWPPRTSTATRIRSANSSTARATNEGSSAAVVPRIARAAPSSSTASISSSVRTPPPICTGITTAAADVAHHLAVVPVLERGVEVDHVQPARALLLEAGRDRDRVVVRRRSRRSGSPRSSRTARPPRRSIARDHDHAAHLPHDVLVELRGPPRPTSPGGTASRTRCRARRPR